MSCSLVSRRIAHEWGGFALALAELIGCDDGSSPERKLIDAKGKVQQFVTNHTIRLRPPFRAASDYTNGRGRHGPREVRVPQDRRASYHFPAGGAGEALACSLGLFPFSLTYLFIGSTTFPTRFLGESHAYSHLLKYCTRTFKFKFVSSVSNFICLP